MAWLIAAFEDLVRMLNYRCILLSGYNIGVMRTNAETALISDGDIVRILIYKIDFKFLHNTYLGCSLRRKDEKSTVTR